MKCCVDLRFGRAIWDDSGIDTDGYQRDVNGKLYDNHLALVDDPFVPIDAVINDWNGIPIPLINLLQMRQDDEPWQTLDPSSFEYQLITQHWADIFSPDSITCWGIEWNNGMTVYYRWVKANACLASRWSGMASGVLYEPQPTS